MTIEFKSIIINDLNIERKASSPKDLRNTKSSKLVYRTLSKAPAQKPRENLGIAELDPPGEASVLKTKKLIREVSGISSNKNHKDPLPKEIQDRPLVSTKNNEEYLILNKNDEDTVFKGATKVVSHAVHIDSASSFACLESYAESDDPIHDELYILKLLKNSSFKNYPILKDIIFYYDEKTQSNKVKIITDLCKSSLQKEIQDNNLDPKQQNNIFLQMGYVLCDFHKLGLIHRDIKPGNFLIDDQGRILLADFDTAGTPGKVGKKKQTGFHGTVAYEAPETTRAKENNRSRVLATQTTKADIYAYGIAALELYGKLDMNTIPTDSTAQKEVAKILPTLPNTLEFALIKKMLEEDPKKRLDSRELKRELDRIREYRSWQVMHPGSNLAFEEYHRRPAPVGFSIF